MSTTADLAVEIGEIMIRSGVITVEELQQAVSVADKMRTTLGRALEMNGLMKESAVPAARRLKQQIEENNLTFEQATRAFELIVRQGIELQTALRHITPGAAKVLAKDEKNKIGQILSASGVVDWHHLSKGVSHSVNTGLPLGMVLVEMDAALPALLDAALTAQQMVRDGVLTMPQAVQALRAARLRSTSLLQSLKDHNFPTSAVKSSFGLGELLVLASVITETQLLAAREIELVEEKQFEDVLIECGIAQEHQLKACHQLLSMINEGLIFEEQAATIVRKLKRARSEAEIAEILSKFDRLLDSEESTCRLEELLIQARIIDADVLAGAIQHAATNKLPLDKVLVESGVVPAGVFQAALRCKQYIDRGAIDTEQGIIALSYAIDRGDDFETALDRFGWKRIYAGIAS